MRFRLTFLAAAALAALGLAAYPVDAAPPRPAAHLVAKAPAKHVIHKMKSNALSCVTGATTPSAVIAEINNCLIAGGNVTAVQLNAISRDIVGLINSNGIYGYVPQNYIIGNIAGFSNPPTGIAFSSFLDSAIAATPGTIAYRGNSGWVGLPPGTSGQALELTVGLLPYWNTVPGTGTVTQVIAGSGLAGGTITGVGTLTRDWTFDDDAGVTQTVKFGPVSVSGYPNFLPSTNASLAIGGQNVSGTFPLILSAWAAVDSNGAHNLQCVLASNPSWSSLTASQTNYLYFSLSTSGGVCSATPLATILAPIYQLGGTPSTTLGQITCNIGQRQCYLGNGSTAPQTTLVLVGEAVTNGSTVTSSVNYAYNGFYDSGYTATLIGTSATVSVSHNLGGQVGTADLVFQCTSADQGYSVGDTLLYKSSTLNNGNNNAITIAVSRNGLTLSTSSGSWTSVVPKGGGANTALTSAKWSYKFIVKRAF